MSKCIVIINEKAYYTSEDTREVIMNWRTPNKRVNAYTSMTSSTDEAIGPMISTVPEHNDLQKKQNFEI